MATSPASRQSTEALLLRAGIDRCAQGAERAWIILGCAWLLAFAMYCPMLCIPPMVHIIKREMGVSNAQLGFLFSVPVTTLVAIAIPSGLLADRLGTRRAVGIGAVVMAAGSLLRGTATTFGTLLVFTGLYGIGFSIVYPNLPKLVGLWFPREKVGLATGVYSTGITAGSTISLALTLPLILPLAKTIQGAFVLWSAPAAVAALLWWVIARDPPHPRPTPVDGPRGASPTGSLWKDKNMWLIALLLFLNNFHFYTWSGWTPALLMLKGARPELAALIASSRGWSGLPAMFLMPWVSHKIGLRRPFIWGSALLLVLASWVALYAPVSLGWPIMAVVGITTSGTFSMILALPLEILPNRSMGTATGTVLAIGYLGGLAGPWLAGRMMDSTGSLNMALVTLAATGLIWTFIGFLIPESGRNATPSRQPGET